MKKKVLNTAMMSMAIMGAVSPAITMAEPAIETSAEEETKVEVKVNPVEVRVGNEFDARKGIEGLPEGVVLEDVTEEEIKTDVRKIAKAKVKATYPVKENDLKIEIPELKVENNTIQVSLVTEREKVNGRLYVEIVNAEGKRVVEYKDLEVKETSFDLTEKLVAGTQVNLLFVEKDQDDVLLEAKVLGEMSEDLVVEESTLGQYKTEKQEAKIEYYEVPIHVYKEGDKLPLTEEYVKEMNEKEKTMADTHEIKKDDIEEEVVKIGEKIDLTDNIKNLPKGTKVEDITENTIPTDKELTSEGLVKVVFEDGSYKEVKIPVKVVENLSATWTPKFKDFGNVPVGAKIDLTTAITNLPKDAKIEVKEDVKTDTEGKYVGVVTVTFDDGVKRDFNVEVNVVKATDGKGKGKEEEEKKEEKELKETKEGKEIPEEKVKTGDALVNFGTGAIALAFGSLGAFGLYQKKKQ